MQIISDKPTCAVSQFYDWLIRRNVRVIDSWDYAGVFASIVSVCYAHD